MEARRFSELADISLISNNMNLTYYESVKERYRRMINPEAPRLPDKPPGFVIESGSKDAFALMKSVGRNLRRNLGYG